MGECVTDGGSFLAIRIDFEEGKGLEPERGGTKRMDVSFSLSLLVLVFSSGPVVTDAIGFFLFFRGFFSLFRNCGR